MSVNKTLVVQKDPASAQESPMRESFSLEQNHPNPFNVSTLISYQLPVDSSVTLKVHDVSGKEIATLVDTEVTAGEHSVVWNAEGFSSGLYLYSLTVGNRSWTRKMAFTG